MRTLFTVLFLISVLLYSSKPTISFKPFSISFESPFVPFAILFLLISIIFFGFHYQMVGYSKGVKDMSQAVKK